MRNSSRVICSIVSLLACITLLIAECAMFNIWPDFFTSLPVVHVVYQVSLIFAWSLSQQGALGMVIVWCLRIVNALMIAGLVFLFNKIISQQTSK